MRFLQDIPNEILSDPHEVAAACRRILFQTVETNEQIYRLFARQGRPIPNLYDPKLRIWFCREPWAGKLEEFANVLTIIERGWTDCDDACAAVCARYRAGFGGVVPASAFSPAEWRKTGIKIYWRPPTEERAMTIHHAQVRLPNGKIEDPSRRLPGG